MKFKKGGIRPGFFFEMGACFGISGLLILMMFYYGVTDGPIPAGRGLLAWLVPTGIGCCFLGAVALSAGLATRMGKGSNGQDDRPSAMRRTETPIPSRPRPECAGRPAGEGCTGWTPALLRSLEWKAFRDLGAAYFREVGLQVVTDKPGRPNGVDLWLYEEGDSRADIALRCMPWGIDTVDARQVRDFYRTMQFLGVSQGVILASGVFSDEAFDFAGDKRLELIGGEELAARLASLPKEVSEELLREASLSRKIGEEKKEKKTFKRQKKNEPVARRRWFGF